MKWKGRQRLEFWQQGFAVQFGCGLEKLFFPSELQRQKKKASERSGQPLMQQKQALAAGMLGQM
jgi:hypothetical protein